MYCLHFIFLLHLSINTTIFREDTEFEKTGNLCASFSGVSPFAATPTNKNHFLPLTVATPKRLGTISWLNC